MNVKNLKISDFYYLTAAG